MGSSGISCKILIRLLKQVGRWKSKFQLKVQKILLEKVTLNVFHLKCAILVIFLAIEPQMDEELGTGSHF